MQSNGVAVVSLLDEQDGMNITESLQICGSWVHIVDKHLAPAKLTADQEIKLLSYTGIAFTLIIQQFTNASYGSL